LGAESSIKSAQRAQRRSALWRERLHKFGPPLCTKWHLPRKLHLPTIAAVRFAGKFAMLALGFLDT
jgi:hypothetical protein